VGVQIQVKIREEITEVPVKAGGMDREGAVVGRSWNAGLWLIVPVLSVMDGN
jgi:hypothetical protein